jgi:hypothetical protein
MASPSRTCVSTSSTSLGEQQAKALTRFLQRETDYDVAASSSGGGFLKKKVWAVNGTT